MLGALLLARRNLRLGRGDRKGAARIAITVLIAVIASWLFLARHATDAAEFDNYTSGAAWALYWAAYVYLAYLAVEPYVRRRWPNMLVSWTRALAGRFADPRVGRDLLAGCLAGVLTSIVTHSIAAAVITWFNVSGLSPTSGNVSAIRGWADSFGMVAYCLFLALIFALAGVVILLLAQLVARHAWLTISLWITVYSFGALSVMGLSSIIAIPIAVVVCTVLIFVLFRFGIVGMTATHFMNLLIGGGLLTVDPSRWCFRSSALVLVLLAAMAVHGFRAALAGRPVFGRAILED